MAFYEVTAIVGPATVREVLSIDSANLSTEEVANLAMEIVLDRWKASFGVDFSKIADTISSHVAEEVQNDEN